MWDFNSENEKVQDIQSDYLVKLWNLAYVASVWTPSSTSTRTA